MNRHRVPNLARSRVVIVDIAGVNAADLIHPALVRAVDPDRIRAALHRTMEPMNIRTMHPNPNHHPSLPLILILVATVCRILIHHVHRHQNRQFFMNRICKLCRQAHIASV